MTPKEQILTAETKPEMAPLQFGNVPTNIRHRKQFVCWRWERRTSKDKGIWTKVPVNPVTGKNAKANDSGTWGGYDQAVAYYEAHRDTVDGVGVMTGDGLTGIDLDDAVLSRTAFARKCGLYSVGSSSDSCRPAGQRAVELCPDYLADLLEAPRLPDEGRVSEESTHYGEDPSSGNSDAREYHDES